MKLLVAIENEMSLAILKFAIPLADTGASREQLHASAAYRCFDIQIWSPLVLFSKSNRPNARLHGPYSAPHQVWIVFNRSHPAMYPASPSLLTFPVTV